MRRRKFIEHSMIASTSVMVPTFFSQCASRKEQEELINALPAEKRLIVIQLSGGNDGLNTIVPYRNDIYYRSRPKIHIPSNEVLKSSDELGFNPMMKEMERLFEKNELTVINSVGYPNASRSHFRSMDVWHSGYTEENKMNTGWIGRYLDHSCNNLSAIEIDDTLSLALKGRHCNGFSLTNTAKLKSAFENKSLSLALNRSNRKTGSNTKIDFLYKTLVDTNSNAHYLYNKSKTYNSTVEYPKTVFGQNLKLISKLITAQLPTKIYYASLSGFDTHARQSNKQNKLLETLSSGVAALVQDLKNHQLYSGSTIMIFSEFGRRLQENGSMGTDHGKGNNLLLIGNKLAVPGFYNKAADLARLDEGDVSFQIDFRSVYKSLIEDWLDGNSSSILNNNYSKLNLFS